MLRVQVQVQVHIHAAGAETRRDNIVEIHSFIHGYLSYSRYFISCGGILAPCIFDGSVRDWFCIVTRRGSNINWGSSSRCLIIEVQVMSSEFFTLGSIQSSGSKFSCEAAFLFMTHEEHLDHCNFGTALFRSFHLSGEFLETVFCKVCKFNRVQGVAGIKWGLDEGRGWN